MNHTLNCTFEDNSQDQDVGTYAYIITLLVLGIIFNAVALWVFCCHMRKKWTETVIYMTNLAAADLCLLCALPIMIYSTKHIRDNDTVLCQVSQSIYLVNKYMSISIITIIAIDRYVAIRFPMQAKRLRSPRRSAIICAVLWALVIVFMVIQLAIHHDGPICFFTKNFKPAEQSIFSLLVFYVSLSILTFCSIQVIVSLVRKKKIDEHEKKVIRKVICIISANLLVFLACFLPMHVVLSVRFFIHFKSCSSLQTWKKIMYFTSRLSNANCCLDAICYYFVTREFQEASPQTFPTLSRSYKLQDSTQATTD